jgi:hypothetical protein
MKRESSVLETKIADALTSAGIKFITEQPPANLDFYLPEFDIYIEVKAFHSDRIAEQMSRVGNVIAVQGVEAAKFLAKIIEAMAK